VIDPDRQTGFQATTGHCQPQLNGNARDLKALMLERAKL